MIPRILAGCCIALGLALYANAAAGSMLNQAISGENPLSGRNLAKTAASAAIGAAVGTVAPGGDVVTGVGVGMTTGAGEIVTDAAITGYEKAKEIIEGYIEEIEKGSENAGSS